MSDLLSDLQADAVRRTAAAPAAAPAGTGTPALELRVTPLRWSRPRLAGGAVVVGPLRVAVTRR